VFTALNRVASSRRSQVIFFMAELSCGLRFELRTIWLRCVVHDAIH
jgi:hypothetical protein